MSYQVLARKWRPKTFDQVVGQQAVLTALANGLRENRLHHAYLFSGTRGVGKTSIARLFAKGLNCEKGVTAEPCGTCRHCKAIEEGNFIDLIEIDAASRTKVEDTRELLDNVQYKPVQGRYKVYLIDEVHMLSRHSFNALLKTLEEPPEYVKFLLATTDPQKLPVTILSRCMQFHLKALQPQEISQHLEFILKAENIPYEYVALEKIAIAAEGSIRDSLSLTDQAIALSNGNITLETVQTMLGLMDENQAMAILIALARGDGISLMQQIQSVADKGGDWQGLLNEIISLLHKVALQQFLKQETLLENEDLLFLAKNISPEDVQFFYQIILKGSQELSYAPTPRMAAEMVLLRALAFQPKFSAQELNQGAKQLTQQGVASIGMAERNTPRGTSVEQQIQPTVTASPGVRQNIAQANIPQETVTAVTPQAGTESMPIAHSHNRSNAPTALSALDSLAALKQKKSEQKKKPKLSSINATSAVRDSQALTHQPITGLSKSDSQRKATPSTEKELKTSFAKDKQEQDGVTYRWQWINPELALVEQQPTVSDIKQAISQQLTPELQERVIEESCKQDPWAKQIEQLNISGILKDMAVNTIILQEEGNHLSLGIRENKYHLVRRYQQRLQQALQEYRQQNIELSIQVEEDPTKLTPTDFRRKIYTQLCEQAHHALQQDALLQRIIQEFDGELILENVRPK